MKSFTIISVIIAMNLSGGGSIGPAARKELAELQGDWWIVSLERRGKKHDYQEGERVRLMIKDGSVSRKSPDQDQVSDWFSMTINSEPNPKILDLKFKNGVAEGIYQINGDSWKMCFNPESRGVKDRPIEFGTAEGNGYVIFVMRRVKD